MYRVSPEIVEQYFVQNFRRGAVLRFSMECDDPNRKLRDKFGVVLNRDDQNDPDCFLAITTSQLAHYQSGRFENDIVRVAVGTYAYFKVETIINLREVKVQSKENLKRLSGEQRMSFEGNLNQAHMLEIDRKIQASILIELGKKKKILPGAV